MLISQITKLLDAEIFCLPNEEKDILCACGSDLMSDALAFVKADEAMLLTGLLNPQSIRTAQMLDMYCIAFVRGKKPTQTMIDLAKNSGIALISTPYAMFTSCGILYSNGLKGGA